MTNPTYLTMHDHVWMKQQYKRWKDSWLWKSSRSNDKQIKLFEAIFRMEKIREEWLKIDCGREEEHDPQIAPDNYPANMKRKG